LDLNEKSKTKTYLVVAKNNVDGDGAKNFMMVI
jgi:hypothetical protein